MLHKQTIKQYYYYVVIGLSHSEKFKDLFVGEPEYYGYHLYLDYDHQTDDITTVDGEFFAKGTDFENTAFTKQDSLTSLSIFGDFSILNETPDDIEMSILCQHD